ncbi:hypothetical protein PHLCEN_2v9689 [Hermanssonia centrifuga]|uniref:C2H2-type domain-containing protein n=1 Tax=Hermanssonia centrifuga TaxID=98765 RepID=A0A2R6NQ14_9APHY|nr:hypothetical protein PHLCEN_2v9689 [Hermanssonia centrifuga]
MTIHDEMDVDRPSPLSEIYSVPSSSPHIPFNRLSLADERSYPQAQGVPSNSWSQHGTARPHPSYPDNARAASPAQVRNPTDAGRPASRQGQRNYPPYGHPSAIPRHIDPNALATSGYPYAASQPIPPNQYQAQQAVAGVSSGAGMSAHEALSADRSSSGRYECQWCGKGFTRPSSLKATYVCPFEGCGRSFSVQSNMRRHARVHTRAADASGELDEEEEESESASASNSASHSRGNSGSSK